MQLAHGIHLGYCTNIHRGESWAETFSGLDQYTLKVRDQVAKSDEPYGIGLRLSAQAAEELQESPGVMDDFRRWLDENRCYVFSINGFPYGKFHNTRVKEQVYAPDWTTTERLDYTVRLFELIDKLAPSDIAGSVSTLPGSFKEFLDDDPEPQIDAIVKNLRLCSDAIDRISEASGRDLHLGLEPEPLGFFETTPETVTFFDRLTDGVSSEQRDRLMSNLGVNYDTCHLALEYENAPEALGRLTNAGIRLSKIHLSSALQLTPTPESRERLAAFQDEVYLHQVIVREGETVTHRFRDLPDTFEWANHTENVGDEWRVHFHVPIHAQPEAIFGDTREHITGTMDALAASVASNGTPFCQHFEMETYTWEVLPEAMRAGNVVDQLVREYDWCTTEFARVGLRG